MRRTLALSPPSAQYTPPVTPFATAVLFGSCLAFAGFVALYFGLFHDRSRGRLRCPHCWYNMTSLATARCPECGQASRPHELHATRRRWGAFATGIALLMLAAGLVIPVAAFQLVAAAGAAAGPGHPLRYKPLNNKYRVLIWPGTSCALINQADFWVVPDDRTPGTAFTFDDPGITSLGLAPPFAIGRLDKKGGNPAESIWFDFDGSTGDVQYFNDETSAAAHWRSQRGSVPPALLHPDTYAR